MRGWRITAYAFGAMLVLGSVCVGWIMIRDGNRIHQLEQRLQCWEAGKQPSGLVP